MPHISRLVGLRYMPSPLTFCMNKNEDEETAGIEIMRIFGALITNTGHHDRD